jgi:uncharacterized Zn finger protein
MDVDNLIIGYFMLFLGILVGVIFYSEIRRKRFEPTPSEDHIFRCIECGYVYTDDADVDRSRCQQCGTINIPIRF